MNKTVLTIVIIFLLIGVSVVSSTDNNTKMFSNKNQSLNNVNNQKVISACDHLAYIGTCMVADWLYEFNLNDPFNFTLVCSDDVPSCSAGAVWTNEGKIIFINYGLYPWLGSIDPETCYWYWIMGGGENCDGLAWNSVNNRLFGTNGMYLYEFDPETGEQTEIGPHSQPADIILCDIACDGDGIMYGWESFNQRRLCTVDIDTGEATVVGELNIAPHIALEGAFCLEDDILYIFAGGPDPNCLYLYECDEDTGSCNIVDQSEEYVAPYMFVIPWNYPPNASSNPIPYNGETGVDLDADLTWTCSDPDGDSLTYDVYFGDNSQPPLVSSNQSTNVYDPGTMSLYTTYYWKIVAKDEHDAETESPIWSFTTRGNNPPNMPNITGPTNGKTGTSYNYTFTSIDPDGDDIYYYIDWGDGTNSGWLGPYKSGTEIIESHSWDQGEYIIAAKAKDIYDYESDWGYLWVTMPRNRLLINSLFMRFLEHFPNAFPILRQLLELKV